MATGDSMEIQDFGSYTIRRLADDEPPPQSALELLRRRLLPEMSERVWLWQYRNDLATGSAYIAEAAGKVVGHLGFVRLPFRIEGRLGWVGMAEDGVTDDSFRDALPQGPARRMFFNLVRFALGAAASRKFDAYYGFPNQRAIHPQVAAGYTALPLAINNVRQVLRYRRARFPLTLVAPAIDVALRSLSAMRARVDGVIRPPRAADEGALDRYAAALANEAPMHITPWRSWSYLKWRYVDNPYGGNEVFVLSEAEVVRGVLGLRISERGGLRVGELQDVSALDEEALRRLLHFAVRWGKERDADFLEAWAIPGAPAFARLNGALRASGYRRWVPTPRSLIVWSTIGDGPYDAGRWEVTKAFRRA
jgi:hypothetical protein